MAANDIYLVDGPVKIIRPTADADKSKGHAEIQAASYGFWLHDVSGDSEGSFCVDAHCVSVARTVFQSNQQTNSIPAGSAVYVVAGSGLSARTSRGGSTDSGNPGTVGIIFKDVESTDSRVLMVLEHH